MTADERINALLERAGCPVMVVKSDAPATPERHMAYLIDRLEVALENALDERDHRLNALRDAIYEDAVEHGLWDDMDNLVCAQTSAVIAETRELIEAAVELAVAMDRGDDLEAYMLHFEEELADVVIGSLSLAGKRNIDIDAAVRTKMEINKGRPWRHEE